MNPDEIIKQAYIGKTINSFEFGQNEPGNRTATLPQKITDARIMFDGEDAGIEIELENGEIHFLYMNERIF